MVISETIARESAREPVIEGCRKCLIQLAVDDSFIDNLPTDNMPPHFARMLGRLDGIRLLGTEGASVGVDLTKLVRATAAKVSLAPAHRPAVKRWLCSVTHD